MRIVLPAFSFLLLVACGGDEGAGFTASITSPSSGMSVVEKQVVLLEGQVSDGIRPIGSIEAAWWSGERLLCRYKLLDENGGTTCEAKLKLGESMVTLLARKPGLAGLPDEVVQDEQEIAVLSETDAPRCELLEPSSDWGLESGETLGLVGSLWLPETDVSGETLSWVSDVDGELGSSTADAAGRVEFILEGLSDGKHTVEMRYESEEHGMCQSEIGIGIGPAPQIEIVTPSEAVVVVEGSILTAIAEVTHSESVRLSWISDRDGTLKTRTIRAGGQSTLSTDVLSAGVHELTAVGQDSLGVPGLDSIEVTVKGIPTAPEIALSPTTAFDEDSLTVEIVVDSIDPEGGSLVYRTEWLQDGRSVDLDVKTIASSRTSPGETWDVLVWAESSSQSGHVAQASVTIGGFLGWGSQHTSLSTASTTVRGDREDDRVGTALASDCDLDGDGYDDLVVGAPFNDEGGSNAGRAYVVRGLELMTNATVDLYHSTESLVGAAAGDYSGSSLACNGDIDGDGLEDLLVGAPGHANSSGAVYLVTGADFSGDFDLFDSSFSLEGENPGDLLGTRVEYAGDVDGDGLSEVILGAWANDDEGTFSGKVYLLGGDSFVEGESVDLADSSHMWVGESPGDRTGHSVAGLGDVDGDGLADIGFGGYGYDNGGTVSYQGAAYIELSSNGMAGGENSAGRVDQILVGEDLKHYAGYDVSSLGDLDEDGLDDVLVSALGFSSSTGGGGGVYVVWGSELVGGTLSLADVGSLLEGEMVGDKTGSVISGIGDVDRDGLPDFLVGAPSVDADYPDGGQAYLMLGGDVSLGSASVSLGHASYVFTAAGSHELAGTGVGGGDFNGDGMVDLVIGAPAAGTNKPYRGHAYIMLAQ